MDRFDARAVEVMLGRAPRGDCKVARRCHHGLPAVVQVPPVLPGGEPFPTLYWLTCPLAVRRVGRVEDAGGVREMTEAMELAAADADYARRRDAVLAELVGAGRIAAGAPVPAGGVGGAHGTAKCLHGRYAFWLVGGDDPAGAETARRVGVLDCSAPCVDEAEPARVRIQRGGRRGLGPRLCPDAPPARDAVFGR